MIKKRVLDHRVFGAFLFSGAHQEEKIRKTLTLLQATKNVADRHNCEKPRDETLQREYEFGIGE